MKPYRRKQLNKIKAKIFDAAALDFKIYVTLCLVSINEKVIIEPISIGINLVGGGYTWENPNFNKYSEVGDTFIKTYLDAPNAISILDQYFEAAYA